jgi:hypothetical protein
MEADYWLWFPGMGLGDIKLLAMIGAFLGPVGVMTTIMAASVLGLLLGLAWALATRSWRAPFGFGPAIAMGALAALLLPKGMSFEFMTWREWPVQPCCGDTAQSDKVSGAGVDPRRGFEPRFADSESAVLPLDDRGSRGDAPI